MKLLIKIIFLLGLSLFSFQGVFAYCKSDADFWGGVNHPFAIEVPDIVSRGEDFDVRTTFESNGEKSYLQFADHLSIDFFLNDTLLTMMDLGSIPYGLNGCTAEERSGLLYLNCDVSFTYHFSDSGVNEITAVLHNGYNPGRSGYQSVCASQGITVRSICPNGVVEFDEECEGDVPVGRTCQDYGWSQGILKCNSDCHIDKSGCSGVTPKKLKLNPLTCNTLGSCFDLVATVLLYVAIGGVSLSIIIAGAIFITGATPAKLALAKKIILWGIGLFVIMLLVKLVSLVSNNDLTNLKNP
jgi:hypothetical protein